MLRASSQSYFTGRDCALGSPWLIHTGWGLLCGMLRVSKLPASSRSLSAGGLALGAPSC